MQNNRLTFMERLSERLTSVEAILKKLDPIESLLERIALLEKNIYTTKQVFTFQEACMYIGISESMLYKLTSGKEIPHYKPRGKMIYFAKEDLDEWLLQNYEPTVDEAARMAGVVPSTVSRWAGEGYFRYTKTDKILRIKRDSFENWLEIREG